MNGFQPTGFDELPEEPERGPRIGLIVGILILLVVLVGGGFGGYFYLNRHDNSTTITATPTLAPTPTPSGKPLFSDFFVNNDDGWNLQGAPGKFSVKVGGGFMVLEDDDNKLLWELVPGGKTFNNFRLGVDAVLSKGTQDNGYGVYIRGASTQAVDLATYYRFELYGDGTFAVFKGTVDGNGNSTSSILVNYTVNAAILKQGSLNHIAITANGPKMTFMVNGQTVSTVSDNSYTSGSVALFVSNLKNSPPGAQATFSKLAIYPVANS